MATRATSNDQDFAREWFTAAELAELALPGLPADKRSINRRAQEERWSTRTDAQGRPLVRPRDGRGGGLEFHVSLLPGPARLELSRRGLAETRPEPVAVDAGGWRWFEEQSGKVKAEAERRLRVLGDVALLESAGMTRTSALTEVSGRHGLGKATLWNWLGLVDGVVRSDWLPALAPRRKGGGSEADIDPALWSIYKSDVLRASPATLKSCYDRTAAIATQRGLSLPCEATMRRRFKREVHPAIVKLKREGEEALRRSIPAQRRTVEHLQALEMVNVDGHKFDVLVIPPDGGKPVRPIMVGIQDVLSSKLLAWKLDLSENAVQTRLAFARLFEEFGIPKVAVMDNGRAFASKWVSGGAKTRFRFKIKPEEPTGFLTALGVEVKWALPYRGQSKPIERAWRDLCDTVSCHPAMEGAYTGNSTVNKPHNYGTRAIPWAEFELHVARQITLHNAKLGRKGRHYRERSFDDVFATSYATAQIGKCPPEKLRLALLTAEQKMANSQTGEIALFGNRYWSEECDALHGQRLTVRFDPDNLHSEIYLYATEGHYLGCAQMIADSGFDSVAGAKATGKRLADYRRRIRDAADAEQLLAAEEVAALQAYVEPAPMPEVGVIRPVRHRGNSAAALKVAPASMPAPRALPSGENKILNLFGRLRPDDE